MKKKLWIGKEMLHKIYFLRRFSLIIITLIFVCSFSTRNSGFYIKPVFTPEFMVKETHWADSVLQNLSLEEKIGQLLMVQVFSDWDEDQVHEIEKSIVKHKIGGIIFSKGGPVRQANLTNRFQKLSDVPLLIAMDAEWGLGMRLDSTISYPYQMTLGAINDNSLIYKMGEQIAEQCKRLGIQMNFSPVVDVNNNPLNPIINQRSFGENRANVMAKGLMYMLGMQDHQILTTIKHFPGHGDTEKDSHLTLPEINHSAAHIDSIELYPFEQLINNGATGVMIAHLYIPALDSTTKMASTLSPLIVTDLLKKQMGFGGLVVTDALSMRGVSEYLEPGELEAQAFKAGNDILLMPSDVLKAINTIKREVRRGRISEEDIDQRCHKILKAKEWAGLNNMSPIETKRLVKDLNKPEYEVLKNKLIESSVTLLKNKNNLIPFRRPDTLTMAVVSLNTDEITTFQHTFDLYKKADHFIPKTSEINETLAIIDTLKHYNTIIIGIHNTNNSVGGKFGIKSNDINFIYDILGKYKNIILTVFGNPYALKYFGTFKDFSAVSIAYQANELNESMMAQALFGGIAFRGKIPVKPHHEINLQTGYNTIPARLAYNIPEYVQMNRDTLHKIETIVNKAIADKATPGCQIFVARKGVVVYHQAFGHHTYRKKQKVDIFNLYDIASLTKIFATTTSVMKLFEEGTIKIDTAISAYLPYLDTTNKKDTKIIDIMTHMAQLPAWIPFYISTIEGLYPDMQLFNNKISDHYSKNIYITRFLQYVEGLYTKDIDENHHIKVADGLYLLDTYRDTIFNKIASCELIPKNGYKYSDLGFYLLYDMIEKQTNEYFPDYVNRHFFYPIGAEYTTFKPLEKYKRNQIVPTEDDLIFRKQLLHGYVHDPGAAMLGGVCGHAGLFSNANDLGKIMQMLLNGGDYGYQNYFKKETIDFFTSSPYSDKENRRGIGFDKPPLTNNGPSSVSAKCSMNSFGHTGFTGTIAWADQQKEIIYIFLSNRIHPDQNNNKLANDDVRMKIQDIIYNSLME